MPEILDEADGSQDALIVRVDGGGHTGWGECEASPLTSIANFICPKSHSAAKPIRESIIDRELNDLNDVKKKWPTTLPSGIIHGDLFVDNIFFKKNQLSGIIDFYFAANDFFMYEIAICINALCFDRRNYKFKINNQKIKSLIKGYESVRKISIKEKKSLNILCRGAAIRYLLTRLYDYSNTPKTALIQIKDPNEYYQKLITHNYLKSYDDYLA